ncbi:MAG: DNA mismatch repair protein MutS [Gammaproteobacteria bacterium]|nr:MAG: DNA mismatch repair protein MutS [Gammaproteobacteria bacterium]
MRRPRGLLPDEAELWGRVARTVTPLRRVSRKLAEIDPVMAAPLEPAPAPKPAAKVKGRVPPPPPPPVAAPERQRPLDRHGLDGSWEKKLARAEVHPDFTLDLHGHGLDAAYARLDHGLAQALAMGARVVLVITGKPRPVEAADRGERRGAIRAKLLDWLAHGSHAHRIASVRGAHRKHGGSGAVYVILKRTR